MKKPVWLAMAVIAAAALAGCSKPADSSHSDKTVEIVSTTMAFETKEVTLDKGVTVKLVFNNKDSQLHDLSIDKIPGKVGHAESGGDHHMANEPDLHISANASKSGSVEFTPSEAGTYTYYCTVPGHKDAGMVGKLIVK